jgi:hypothetical protein
MEIDLFLRHPFTGSNDGPSFPGTIKKQVQRLTAAWRLMIMQ